MGLLAMVDQQLRLPAMHVVLLSGRDPIICHKNNEKKPMKSRIFLLITSMLFTVNCSAETEKVSTLEQLSWLSGCWTGTGLGGEVEECWMGCAIKII